jgi:hypothetical protein
MRTFPKDALEIHVVGKQWAWEMVYKSGVKTSNLLVVPVNTDVKLIMSSNDVLHSFYIPSMRIKQDVIPGRYTALGFKAEKMGDYHIFCTEYCGNEHSRMLARLKVLPKGEFERWLAAVEPTLLPSEPLAQAVPYYRRHRDALFRFLEDPIVPLDNSATEREFQNFAKLRLNMLFAGSTEGAHRACTILGIATTCRAIGVSFQAYLAWYFERVGTHRDLFGLRLEDLTPAAFKKSLG